MKKSKRPKRSPKKGGRHPAQREVLFRPDRLDYVRGKTRKIACVFCESLEAGANVDSLLIYRNDHACVILNKYPYNPGHLLILPIRHVPDLTDMTTEELHAFIEARALCVRILKRAYEAPAINIGMNLGKIAGAGIPEHLHEHVIPRWAGDTNFFPLIAGSKVVVETLAQSYARLRPLFEGGI